MAGLRRRQPAAAVRCHLAGARCHLPGVRCHLPGALASIPPAPAAAWHTLPGTPHAVAAARALTPSPGGCPAR
jgi:hypothetical protein